MDSTYKGSLLKFIAAFLPPKIMQADNGKEFKGALLILLRKSSHIDWLNSQARKDLTIGIEQEDPTMGPIFESELQPELELESETEALIDPQLRREPELGIELSSLEPERELDSRLRVRAGIRTRTRARTQLRQALELRIELSSSELNSEASSSSKPELEPERELDSRLQVQARIRTGTRTRAGTRAQLRRAPELRIEISSSELNSEPSSGSDPEPELELDSEPRRGTRARVLAQPRTELRATPDPVVEKAIAATQRARVAMIRKYTKKHDIQHFDIGAIVSLKIP
ncbi:hypothetical protein V498_01337 [Pseudogymnoascus sp. VKM F-4517 (FW-2822)]|nr:hypothetical protein V498_01337 [Pseudogymnoascus sp. VKM F-4517 (FW-2822)]